MDRPVKQRLWGAAVLIALAVIFLPMLVKGPAPDSGVSDVPLDSPKAPDTTVKTQELQLDVPGAVGANGATGMPAAQAGTDTPANTSAATTPPASNAAATPTDAKPSPATAAGDYAVSFGSYGSSSDADRVVQAVNGIKLHGYSEKVSISGRDAWRVRIGPYPTREAAEVARVQAVQLNPQVKAQVIALDANATQAPAPAPTASTSNVAATPAIATTPIAGSKPVEKPVEAPKPATPVTKPDKPVAATKPAAKPAQTAEAKPVVAQHQDAPTAPKPDQPKPEPKPTDKPAASGTGFAVQIGAFANAAEATALRDKARAAGFSATTDTVKTDKGVLTRVRLGPVVGRDAANTLKTRAQTTLGVSGIVRPSP
ncbi:MAG: SPOR domain-containing protein [Proteobacteria bacterium]|nr:SPOR domain-containing protein [Pseudomonadota bacterium]